MQISEAGPGQGRCTRRRKHKEEETQGGGNTRRRKHKEEEAQGGGNTSTRRKKWSLGKCRPDHEHLTLTPLDHAHTVLSVIGLKLLTLRKRHVLHELPPVDLLPRCRCTLKTTSKHFVEP